MWNKFEATSNEDETLGSSFFTNGLLKISNQEKSTENPSILSSFQNKTITISIDSNLILMEDDSSNESENECKFLSFGAKINCFAISQSGSYIVCCLSDGNIHGIHIKGFHVFTSTINSEDVCADNCFIDIQLIHDKFYILCSNGKVYAIKKIDEENLFDATSQDYDTSCVLNESSLKLINIERISNQRITSKITSFCVVKNFFAEFIIICCNEAVTIIENSEVYRINYTKDIEVISKVFNLESCVVGLTLSGFVEICPLTKMIRKINFSLDDKQPSSIDEVRVLESNEEYIELLTLSRLENCERQMKIIDFPSLKCKSELLLPELSWLVSQPKSSVNMYFIAGFKNNDDFIQSVEIRSITETDPEQRFYKLLLKGHFNEAESYAKICGLNLEPLHEARVKKTLIDLSNAKKFEVIERKFEELMKQITLIEDKNFIVSLRLSNDIPDRTCLTQFLEFIQKNIDANQYSEEINEINEMLLRLETLRLIDPYDSNLEWKRFLHQKDLLRAAMDYFRSDILLSCLIWSRHASSIIPNMNLSHFYKWMNNIRLTIEPFQIIQWLKHFSPCFLQIYPHETTRIVDWCLGRTHSLQFSPKWPEIGLEFINNIKKIFDDVRFMYINVYRSFHSNMERIQKLINILEEMVVLKKRYHLTMSLDDYRKNSFEETAFKLLQRIQIHNMRNLVNDFLYPVFLEHGSSPEDTIVKYINFLATNKNLGYFQERAVIAIDLLNNEENRLNGALLILKVSPVPWSNVVLPLAELGFKSNHPLANLIFVEYKNQAIKMIKIKYGWPVDYFDLQQDRTKLALRILKVSNADMITDIKTLVESSPDIASDAYFFLINRLIELGQIDNFVEFITSIESQSESHKLFTKTINIFIREIEGEALMPEQIKNYIEAVKILMHRLKDTIDDFKYERNMKLLNNMKNILKLREQFNFEIRLDDLKNKENKMKLIDMAIEIISQEILETTSIDSIWNKVNLISQAFEEDIIKIYYMLCYNLNNIYITCKVIDWLCNSVDSIENKQIEYGLKFVSLMIAQQIMDLENNAFQSKQVYDPLAFPLAYDFLIKCLSHYDIFYHDGIMELVKWLTIIRALYPNGVIEATRNTRVIDSKVFAAKKVNGHLSSNGQRRESLSIFDNFEEKKIEIAQSTQTNDNFTPVLQCVCNAIKMISIGTTADFPPYNFLKSNMNDVKSQQLKDDFFSSLENVLKMKLNMDAFIIIQNVVSLQSKIGLMIIPKHFVSTVNKKILKFILSQKEPDYFNAFIIFRSEASKMDCLEYLRGSLRNNSQRIALSTFSEMYNKYKNNDECIVDRESRLKLYYYSELCKHYPSLRTGVNLDNIGISDFLKDLEKRELSIDLIKKLSKDFGWNYQKSLVKQIKIVLRKQMFEYEIKTDAFGKDEIVVKSSVELIKKECLPYLMEITDMNILSAELEKFLEEINDYFYELFLVVLDFIEYSKDLSMQNKLYKNILFILMHKLTLKRRSIESEEYEKWMAKCSGENVILPTISSWRLPFSMIVDLYPEDVISKDLNVETFEKYLPLIQMHSALYSSKFDVNERIEKCALTAAKNSVQDMRNQAEATVGAQWNLKPRNNAFLQSVIRMVGHLKDKGKALAILYFIVTNTPSGCDQMEAAFECWKFAISHESNIEVQQKKYVEVVDKIKRKYPLLKTQHLLYLYGIHDDKLLQMIEDPVLLINTLYNHDSILSPQKKEINKLCDEIAQLYNLDLMAIQVKLIKHLLAFSEESQFEDGDANETVYEDFMGSPSVNEETSVSDENVIRAYYILGSWPSDISLDFLVTELNSDRVHAENQLQLFECFAKLVDENNISYLELINTNNYLLLRVCHFLKSIGFNIKPAKFETQDKIELLKKIWTHHHNNPKALEAMSLICLGFNVHMPQIWNGILKQMVSFKMISHVSIIVEVLSTKTKFLHLNSLKLAWEYVIQEPLVHGTKIRNYQEDYNLSKALISLQKCPISTFLNLTNLAEKFILLERPHMAAISVAFAKDADREKIINLLGDCNKHELRSNIEELEEFGIAPIITKSVVNILNL